MKELQADMSRLCVSLGDSNQSPSQPEEPLQVAMPLIGHSHLILTRPPYKDPNEECAVRTICVSRKSAWRHREVE